MQSKGWEKERKLGSGGGGRLFFPLLKADTTRLNGAKVSHPQSFPAKDVSGWFPKNSQ